MKRINYGKVVQDIYFKVINFNKAVIWKDREISLHRKVVEDWIPNKGVKKIMLYDPTKEKLHYVKVEQIKKHWVLKSVGQEKQYYFPIEFLKDKIVPRSELEGQLK